MAFPTPKNTPTTPPIEPKAPETKEGTFDAIVKPKSLDDLLKEYDTPKQDFTPKEEPGAPKAPETPEAFSAGFFDEAPQEPITPETARRSGRYIAKAVDSVFGLVGSTIAQSAEAKKYQADESELNDLEEAFGDVSQQYNWEIPPYINLLLIVFFIYASKIKLAFADRLTNIEDRMDKFESAKDEKE